VTGSPDRPGRLPTFGRRRGHALSPRQRGLLERTLPGLLVALRAPGTLDPAILFGHPVRSVWLEIGFGAGEHLAWQAAQNPDIGFLGAEPYVNGIAKLLVAIEERGLANIRVHAGDARDLIDALAPRCLGRVFILFPDPWPKARHHKRRLIDTALVGSLARTMEPGAELRIASDLADYQRWIMQRLLADNRFEWLAASARDWRRRPADWPATRYEKKAIAAGRRPAYLSFRRR